MIPFIDQESRLRDLMSKEISTKKKGTPKKKIPESQTIPGGSIGTYGLRSTQQIDPPLAGQSLTSDSDAPFTHILHSQATASQSLPHSSSPFVGQSIPTCQSSTPPLSQYNAAAQYSAQQGPPLSVQYNQTAHYNTQQGSPLSGH